MTLTTPIRQPRLIDPSLIEVGDDISVTMKPNKGIISTKRGIVAKKVYSGKSQFYMTEEGSTIFAFEPGRSHGLTIMLYGRAQVVSETLFEVDNLADVKMRLAG